MFTNHDYVYKEMTCPSRFEKPKRDSYIERILQNTPKKTPIRKRLLLQGKEVNLYYYKNPSTLTNQGTHKIPSLAL